MSKNKSCVGCKFLYQVGEGYSNYTWLDDVVCCALNLNPNLNEYGYRPSDWNAIQIVYDNYMHAVLDPENDNWPRTNQSRCHKYSPGQYIMLDVDGDDGPADYTDDEEQIFAICKDCGRGPHGYE